LVLLRVVNLTIRDDTATSKAIAATISAQRPEMRRRLPFSIA